MLPMHIVIRGEEAALLTTKHCTDSDMEPANGKIIKKSSVRIDLLTAVDGNERQRSPQISRLT